MITKNSTSRWINSFKYIICWNFSCSFFFANIRTWANELPGLFTLYRSIVKHIFLFRRSTASTILWVSLSCSSMSLDVVVICIGTNLVLVKCSCCNDQLILQSHELVEIWISHWQILYKSKIRVVIIHENFK